ncbi:MAG: hypothetical protein SFT92_01815 [Rickettsiales bacterium]|nr:hypothetical protein [Rickettsiales bacterium]
MAEHKLDIPTVLQAIGDDGRQLVVDYVNAVLRREEAVDKHAIKSKIARIVTKQYEGDPEKIREALGIVVTYSLARVQAYRHDHPKWDAEKEPAPFKVEDLNDEVAPFQPIDVIREGMKKLSGHDYVQEYIDAWAKGDREAARAASNELHKLIASASQPDVMRDTIEGYVNGNGPDGKPLLNLPPVPMQVHPLKDYLAKTIAPQPGELDVVEGFRKLYERVQKNYGMDGVQLASVRRETRKRLEQRHYDGPVDGAVKDVESFARRLAVRDAVERDREKEQGR